MKANPFYIVWGIVSLLLIGGAGFFLLQNKSAYTEKENTFSENESTIGRLERKVPYPEKSAVQAMEDKAAEYEKAVDGLFESLSRFQRPLKQDLRDNDFQQLVLSKRTAFIADAKAKGMAIKGSDSTGEDSFYFGMERYRNTLPASKNVPLLDYQLDAIDRLLRLMLENGVTNLVSLVREPLPTEVNPDAPDPTIGLPVVRYELKASFVADHPAFQKFVNALANDDQFFFLLRVVRIDNSSPDGELTQAPEELGGPTLAFQDSTGADPSLELKAQAADMGVEEQVEFYSGHGFFPVGEDARVLFGEETLKVFAVIDIARFPTPEEKKSDDAADAETRK